MTGGGARPQVPATTTPVEPVVGSAVRDLACARIGVVMRREGPYLQLRPLGGGREWDADPGRVRLLTHAEVLSARVAEVNARSRRNLDLGGASGAPGMPWSGQDPDGPCGP